MQWIILIGDNELNLNRIKAIKHFGSIRSYDIHDNRYCVDFGQDHIFYNYDQNAENDYEQNELAEIPFIKPHFIVMVYTSKMRMRKVLKQRNYLNDVYVDNDHGLIVPIGEFIKLGMPVEPE